MNVNIPSDLLFELLSLLSCDDLSTCIQVCKNWKLVVEVPALWKVLYYGKQIDSVVLATLPSLSLEWRSLVHRQENFLKSRCMECSLRCETSVSIFSPLLAASRYFWLCKTCQRERLISQEVACLHFRLTPADCQHLLMVLGRSRVNDQDVSKFNRMLLRSEVQKKALQVHSKRASKDCSSPMDLEMLSAQLLPQKRGCNPVWDSKRRKVPGVSIFLDPNEVSYTVED
eukprot:GILJ01005437.1.p1 GENE.GILJ01005437.1~~GILJ01005437.1.p1  ORF type:complete len:228 (+),score=18.85 GILJ01005437.1:194-877(+)